MSIFRKKTNQLKIDSAHCVIMHYRLQNKSADLILNQPNFYPPAQNPFFSLQNTSQNQIWKPPNLATLSVSVVALCAHCQLAAGLF